MSVSITKWKFELCDQNIGGCLKYASRDRERESMRERKRESNYWIRADTHAYRCAGINSYHISSNSKTLAVSIGARATHSTACVGIFSKHTILLFRSVRFLFLFRVFSIVLMTQRVYNVFVCIVFGVSNTFVCFGSSLTLLLCLTPVRKIDPYAFRCARDAELLLNRDRYHTSTLNCVRGWCGWQMDVGIAAMRLTQSQFRWICHKIITYLLWVW